MSDKDLQKEIKRLNDIITICHRENDRIKIENCQLNEAINAIVKIAKTV